MVNSKGDALLYNCKEKPRKNNQRNDREHKERRRLQETNYKKTMNIPYRLIVQDRAK